MQFTDTELSRYEKEGAVTIDSPFTTQELDRAEAAWDRLKESGHPPYEDPDYIDVVQHPYFEDVARKVLRAHIVPRNFDWLFESNYEPKWPEIFMER